MKKEFDKILEEFGLSTEELKEISRVFTPIKLLKGNIFIEEGKKNEHIGILFNGLMISTYTSEKGKEEVSRIYSRENGFIIVSNHESFYYNTNSSENIKAIEETTLMVITKYDLNKIFEKFPKLQKIAKDISEKSYINAIDRIKQLQSYKPKERIAQYYSQNKSLFNRVNKQHLASFLGINRNHFSKFLTEIIREI